MPKSFIRFIIISLVLIPAAIVSAYSLETIQVDSSLRDFVVGPGKTDLVISPNSQKVVEIIVSNRTGQDREFEINFQDFTASEDLSSPVVFVDNDSAYSLKDYLSVEKNKFFLRHGTRARIPVTISIPAGAEPGGRYAAILISTPTPLDKDPEPGSAKGGVPLIVQTGTLVFVRVPGEVEVRGELTSFTNDKRSGLYFDSTKVAFNLVYANRGKIHLSPSGVIAIKNIFGTEVRRIQLDPWFALPQALRLRTINLVQDETSDDIFLLGRYTAQAEINLGYDNQVGSLALTFWVIPWKLLLATIIGLLGLYFLTHSTIHWLKTHLEFKKTKAGTDKID